MMMTDPQDTILLPLESTGITVEHLNNAEHTSYSGEVEFGW